MQLPGWKAVGGSAGRYVDPQGNEVSRRSYLNAQAQSVGFKSYGEYQAQSKSTVYRRAIEAADDPKAARKLDSPFNSTFAKNILPSWRKDEMAPKRAWRDAFEALDIEYDEQELWEWYGE